MSQTLMAIDGYSLIYRAFYAMPELTTSRGEPVGAVAGFLNMFFKALDDYQPEYVAVAFDMHGPTFRHTAFSSYKATRKPTPDELRRQFPIAQEILESMGVRVVGIPGYEGDDILGTLSRKAEAQGMDALLITGDRDALQLISDKTRVLLTLKGLTQTQMMDASALKEKYGLAPSQIPDLKGLMGDTSDNIPGIPGVGEKTALALLAKFETLEGLLSHTDELKGKQREKVEGNAQLARISKELATICREAPVEFSIEDCARIPLGQTHIKEALQKYELFSLLRRIEPAVHGEVGNSESPPSRAVYPERQLASLEEIKAAVQDMATKEQVSICHRDILTLFDGEILYQISLLTDLASPGLELAEVLPSLAPLFGGQAQLILHDAKAWMHQLEPYGVSVDARLFDVMLAGYLLNAASGRYDLPRLLQDAEHTVVAAPHAADMWRLAAEQEHMLEERGLLSVFRDIEMPLVRVLCDMERVGFAVDRDVLLELQSEMDNRIRGLESDIFAQAGESFNINSTKQLAEILFTKLELPVIKKNKTGPSTDAAVLEQLSDQHPIIPLLMEYRQVTKLKSTFVDGLLPLIKTGRLHTQLNQTGTATGRLSSSEPNLQNIPVRLPEGHLIRKAFVASPGCVLVDADYSQIELRILAHMAEDPGLIQAFASGKDIHAQTASQVFGVPLEEVTPAMRSGAKAVNFGIIYGISDFGLSRQLGISRSQAGDYITRYLETYRGVKAFMDAVIAFGRENGYVRTLYGRRRPMPDLKARDYNLRSAAERMAMNAPIQGTAADIIKLAMIRVDNALREARLSAKLVLQVHDELILDTPEKEAETVARLLRTAMEQVAELHVPLKVDVHQGKSWFDVK